MKTSDEAHRLYVELRARGYSRQEALDTLAVMGYRANVYVNPAPNPHALPDTDIPGGRLRVAEAHRLLDDVERPLDEVRRRYPSEAWPITPVSKVSYPGLRRAGRRLARRWRWSVPRRVLTAFNAMMLGQWLSIGVLIGVSGGVRHATDALFGLVAIPLYTAALSLVWWPRRRS